MLFSHKVGPNFLQSYGLQHARLPCPSLSPGAYSNSCPLSRWYHPTISSSVIHFSFCLQSSPVSGSFLLSQLFTSGGQSIGVSALASVLPMNIQDWLPSGLTGWISWKWERTVYLDLSNFKGHASSSPSYLHSLIHSFNQYIFIECLLCPRDCLGHWINEWWMK